MRVVIFGATGMVGQGCLRESLLDPEVDGLVTVGRSATGQRHPKLREVVHKDLLDLSAIESDLTGLDACFFCLGISSAGLGEEAYSKVTYGFALSAAQTLLKLNPAMTFVYVSGAGADSTERGSTMWARVKGKAENAILKLGFKAAYAIRPAFIQPRHGVTSRTRSYRVLYAFVRPLVPLLRVLVPAQMTNTEDLGKAMLKIAKHGAPKAVLESRDLLALR